MSLLPQLNLDDMIDAEAEKAVRMLQEQEERLREEIEEERANQTARMEALHKTLYGFYEDELERQAHNRYQQSLDYDYFDSIQWTEKEIQELLERGQAPTVYNIVKPIALWLMGTERRSRIDYKILPREKGDEKTAEIKTHYVKYHDDVTLEKYHRSKAFQDAVIAGVGWLECGASNDPTTEPVTSGSESWRNVLYDSCARSLDQTDDRYLFRHRVVDLDIAVAMFPQHREHLAAVAEDAGSEEEQKWYLNSRVDKDDYAGVDEMSRYRMADAFAPYKTKRKRVLLIEAWYRVPEQCQVCVGGSVHGAVFNAEDPRMKWLEENQKIKLYDKFAMRTRVAFMTKKRVLTDSVSPYRHNKFSLTPIWAYRRDRDGAPYGVVRELRSPQDSFNKRASKAIWRNNAVQIIADHDATNDWENLRTEASRPDGVIIKKKGTALELRTEDSRAQGDQAFMQFDLQMVRENGGVNGDNMGLRTDAQSGRAILARQEQGSLLTAPLMDNLRLGQQLHGEKKLSLIEQYVTEEKVFRVTGEKSTEWKSINTIEFDAEGNPYYVNDITASKADYIVDEQDFRATMRQAMAEQMTDMMSRMDPAVAQSLLPVWLELMDIPDKENVIRAVRAQIGMLDDEDPAQMAIRQAQEQAQQQVEQMQAEMGEEIQSLKDENLLLRARLAKDDGQLELGFAELGFKERDSIRKTRTSLATASMKPTPRPFGGVSTSGAGNA